MEKINDLIKYFAGPLSPFILVGRSRSEEVDLV